jgi:hypothetical protein
MFHGDETDVALRLHSTDQTKMSTEDNILLKCRKKNMLGMCYILCMCVCGHVRFNNFV